MGNCVGSWSTQLCPAHMWIRTGPTPEGKPDNATVNEPTHPIAVHEYEQAVREASVRAHHADRPNLLIIHPFSCLDEVADYG